MLPVELSAEDKLLKIEYRHSFPRKVDNIRFCGDFCLEVIAPA